MSDKRVIMNGVTPEEIKKARELDLLTYLRLYEPQELVHVSGNTYCTREHDSLKISNGAWMWFSRGFGGWTALDYLIHVKGYGFVDAVKIMNQQEVSSKTPVFNCPKPKEKKLLLPEKSADNSRITEYLFSRGIDMEIIRYCIRNGLIYESLPYHNVIFLGFDRDHVPRYGAYRATGSERVLGDAAGSDKRYSFRIMGGESECVHIFESAIDLLSYATLMKRAGCQWEKENMLSLAGVYGTRLDGKSKVPAALQSIFVDDAKIRKVMLHFDNDIAGKRSAAGLIKALESHIEVSSEPPPYGKDYNDYLCSIVRKEIRERDEDHGR